MLTRLKSVLVDRPVPVRIWLGPLRGARIVMNPRSSLRKILGLYEHEINGWLDLALNRASRVLDVGANDGYFMFGAAAAFRRRGVRAEITGFEPQARHVEILRRSVAAQGPLDARFNIVHARVGREVGEGMTTLDQSPADNRHNTLIKIDVEGAEIDVIEGARSWLNASNLFLIEVHKEEYLDQLKSTFAQHTLKLNLVSQRPLPLLGREEREQSNWWLVSDLGQGL